MSESPALYGSGVVSVARDELRTIQQALHRDTCTCQEATALRVSARNIICDLFRRMRETPVLPFIDEHGQCQWCGGYSSEAESDRQVVDVPLMLVVPGKPAMCATCYEEWAHNTPQTLSQPADGPNDGEKDASL